MERPYRTSSTANTPSGVDWPKHARKLEAYADHLEAKAAHYEAVAQKLVDENQNLKAAGRELRNCLIVGAYKHGLPPEFRACAEKHRSLFGEQKGEE